MQLLILILLIFRIITLEIMAQVSIEKSIPTRNNGILIMENLEERNK